MQVTIAEAKARFAEIVRRAEAGERIVLTRHGRPVAHLGPAVDEGTAPLIGALAGRIEMAEGFDDLPEGLAEALTATESP